ncbi:MAG: succinate dehydrogenase iron-sulfur subunit [Gammaproteobacteria bacterium]
MATVDNNSKNRTIKFTIYRYNPDTDKKPYSKDYTINTDECRGVMVLDALELIKTKYEPDLTFRRSCGEGVCGSDGMNINGKNGLACITPFAELPDHVTLRPLPSFPVVRDLIVDMTQFYQQYEKAKPFLINDEVEPVKERLQSQEQRALLDGLYECILCACCSSSCPSYWWNPDKFMGPAALLWAARFILDSRDTAKAERLEALNDAFSLFRCRSIMNCVNVCPKGLNPTKAIGEIRSEMIDHEV